MKDVNSDTAARLVANSCREKFKEKEVGNSEKRTWTVYTSYDDVSAYEDKSTISRHGKIVTVDLVNDFNKLQSDKDGPYYSVILNVEFDCGNLTFRVLSGELKSGHMGEGFTVYKTGLMKEEKFTKESETYKTRCSSF